jgi:hypothetical protein
LPKKFLCIYTLLCDVLGYFSRVLDRIVFKFVGGRSYYKAKEVNFAPLGGATKI